MIYFIVENCKVSEKLGSRFCYFSAHDDPIFVSKRADMIRDSFLLFCYYYNISFYGSTTYVWLLHFCECLLIG